jgi:type IV pilus assembly protein PilC
MPSYIYTAKSLEDKTISGILDARDMRELAKILKNDGLFLVRAVAKGDKNKRIFDFSFSSKVSSADKIMFTKNLSIMIATGLSLVKSFEILANQAKNKKFKIALFAIKEKINKGESIFSALAGYPDIFSDFFLSMIRVGEEAGTSEEVLKILSIQLEKEHKLKSEMQGAMIYPIIVLSLMLVVGIVVAIVVLPKLNKFFIDMGADVPFYTRMLISLGDFSLKNWPMVIISPVILVFLFIWALKTKIGKWLKDTVLLRVPVISSLIKENNCAILIRSLSSLLGSGVSLTTSLQVSSGTVGNFYFKKALTDALERVKKGESLSIALGSYANIFPYGAIEMIEVGEETGKTSVVLKNLADFYEDEVIAATAKLSAIIEPVLIIIIGLVVAVFAFSIIGPMYSSLGAIK